MQEGGVSKSSFQELLSSLKKIATDNLEKVDPTINIVPDACHIRSRELLKTQIPSRSLRLRLHNTHRYSLATALAHWSAAATSASTHWIRGILSPSLLWSKELL